LTEVNQLNLRLQQVSNLNAVGMIKLHYFGEEFFTCRLTDRSMQIFQFEYLMDEMSVFVINDKVLVGSIAASEHGRHKVKNVLSSPHGAD
jgi:hypothetical protein